MDKTTVTCTDTGVSHGADILEQSDRRLKVAIEGTEVAITLFKQNPNDRIYVGNFTGLEFTSTGE